MAEELRCESGKLHGIILAPNVIEIACNHRECGASREVLVLHQFNAVTGQLIATKRYRKPRRTDDHTVALRPA